MRVPISWLREFVDVDLEPEALAVRLTLLGMEVRGIERWGAAWQNVVVGELLAVEKHPRADRLSLTRVAVGDGEALEIVCGATNIAPGQRVPVALPGAVLPGDRRIERTEKMGIVSNGMLCSGDELGMTTDAEGILILEPGTPIGAALTELYGDDVLDVDVKPNRGDALSILGLAREVAAVTGGALREPSFEVAEAGAPVTDHLSVEVQEPTLCTRFCARWVSGVKVGPSPGKVQMRLLAAGQRPISNVVDASNYVMLELGKPVHTFDGAKVRDGRIVVRLAKAGERLTTLDHVDRELHPETLLIADSSGPIGLAGVMGGAESEVSEATTEVAVESAIFDPVNIRRTAFRYALRSEASLRFEKGQEFRMARLGADRTARLVAAWAGGTIATGVIDSNPTEPVPTKVAFRPARVDRLLGTDLAADEQRALLSRVGIATAPAAAGTPVQVAGGTRPLVVDPGDASVIEATVPTWRRDLAVEADIAEEVIRVRGYDQVPSILPHTTMPEYRRDPLAVRHLIREALVGAGLSEAVTFALVSPRMVERFPAVDDGVLTAEPEQRAAGTPITVTNPLSSQHAVLRQSVLGSLLEAMSTNLRYGTDAVALFEVGKGYGKVAGDPPTHEWWRLAFALTGPAEPPAWNRPVRAYDLDDAKGVIELLGARLGFPRPAYTALTDDPNLHPGRSARVDAGGRIVGRVGQLHPATIDALDLRADTILVAELAIEGLAAGQPDVPLVSSPSRQPSVERDVAVIVPETRAAADVEAAIVRHGGALLRQVSLFDIYRGRPLADGDKSLAYRLVLRDDERTLTEAEVEAAVAAIVAGLGADLGARFRT
jgi:phenylalanyl-tRNA synthetase beta chain